MGILQDRVAIVTGASSGAGYGAAKRFAEEGAIVVATARRKDRLDALVAEIEVAGGKAIALECDLFKEEDIDKVVNTTIKQFGRIDILANIGQGSLDKHAYLEGIEVANAVEVYMGGPIQSLLFMQKCFPHMKERNYGRIINCGSQSCLSGLPGFGGYEMAKAAVQALTRTASQEWAKYGITTNVFLPAHWSDAFKLSAQGIEAGNSAAERSPMGKLGEPYEDVSPMVAFLASEGAGYINGQAIAIDGGVQLIA
ncbi:NAD(P)-dependent dehydrogenase (short-subunit alcohol dehydrogenase family) [Sphingobium xenophagum]|uniref:NAD(P)-dependent dehydrogenase (Short-subunit alcohol dehydrogenase family) n=2 Tax=Sphingobium xenophagum TaxID=121428 RepID=A0ABU1X5Z9_SPHXE|nr:NAD(P)-dependent dehydrogenase (short-subunit alcohol dehydrogenase family) [Sphingobium xenophagum]